MMRVRLKVLVLLLLWLVAMALPLVLARAQSALPDWDEAVALSKGHATTDPIIVAGPQGMAQVFWWDASDGLTTAMFDGREWLAPRPAPIPPWPAAETQPEAVPDAEMPVIVGDSVGWAHALWLGAEDTETGLRPLLHSRLALGSTTWDAPNQVADSASAWKMTATTGGALYLVYFQPTETVDRLAGVYYQQSSDGGLTWTEPVALSTARSGSALQDTDFMDIAVSAQGSVYVTWDDPQSGRAMVTLSTDEGKSWNAPQLVHASRLNARHARIVLGRESDVLLLWESTRSEMSIGLYQQYSRDGGQTWRDPEQVLQSWVMNVRGIDLLTLADGRACMVMGGQTGALKLSVWDRERADSSEEAGWSEVQTIGLGATDRALAFVHVGEWHLAGCSGTAIAVGRCSNNQVWAIPIRIAQDEEPYALASPMPQSTATPPKPGDWGEPVNLSRSGSASQPALITGDGGVQQVFWWDQFDGLMTAYCDGQSWSSSAPSPILTTEPVEGTWEPLPQMPQIVGDMGGRAHAFWLMQLQDAGQDEQQPALHALMHSKYTLGGAGWSEPQMVAESVLAWRAFGDPTGGFHLLYVRPTHTEEAVAGIYYTSLARDASNWSAPQVLCSSIYIRLFAAEEMHLAGAADATGNIVAAWYDPWLEAPFITRSGDGGAVWEEPAAVGIPAATQPQVVAVGEGEFLALWQSARTGYASALYQQRSQDGGITWDTPHRALENLNASTEDIAFQSSPNGGLMLIAGMGSQNLALAVWDDLAALDGGVPQWSAPQILALNVRDPDTQEPLWLDALQIAMGRSWIALVGQGQNGEIWAIQREITGLDWCFEPSLPWSELIPISQGQEHPSLPTMAIDNEGQVHVLWGESPGEGLPATALTYTRWDGTGWVLPAQVLQSPDGAAEHPCLVATGERLHAVWSGGPNGQIYYSRAFVRDGSTASGWREPLALPGPQQAQGIGSAPHLVADLGGSLHLVYAVPLNEERGIYYLRSDDGGESWSTPEQIFDASLAGWSSVDQPAIAVDVDGTVYVVWVRASLVGAMAQGVYFARSTDEGQTWSQAFAITEGSYDQPQIAIARKGQVHAIWHGAASGGRWSHRWSADHGRAWAPATQIQGFSDLQGQPALSYDWGGGVYLVGVGLDEVGDPEVRFAAWDNESYQWSSVEYSRVGYTLHDTADVVSALLASRGQMHVVLRGVMPEGAVTAEGSDGASVLMHTQRSIAAMEQTPALLVTPDSTSTPSRPFDPTSAPRPTPTINPEPPPGVYEVRFGPLSLPLLGVGGIVAAGALVAGTIYGMLRKRDGRHFRR